MAVETIYNVRMYIAGDTDMLKSIEKEFEQMAKEVDSETADIACCVIMDELYIDNTEVEHQVLFCMLSFWEKSIADNFDERLTNLITGVNCRVIDRSDIF